MMKVTLTVRYIENFWRRPLLESTRWRSRLRQNIQHHHQTKSKRSGYFSPDVCSSRLDTRKYTTGHKLTCKRHSECQFIRAHKIGLFLKKGLVSKQWIFEYLTDWYDMKSCFTQKIDSSLSVIHHTV